MFEVSDPYEELQNSMGYWYPLLQQIGMRTPETVLVHSDVNLLKYIESPDNKSVRVFIKRLQHAAKYLDKGNPVFLRTSQTSGKHNWNSTCYVKDLHHIRDNVHSLLETSIMANIAGAPWNTQIWAVRKLLPVKQHFEAFEGMPITTEYRFFTRGGKVQCFHEYWAKEAFTREEQESRNTVYANVDMSELNAMAAYVARYFHDYWSVDFLLSEDGKWYCIDMATGDRSYHDPTCLYAAKEARV